MEYDHNVQPKGGPAQPSTDGNLIDVRRMVEIFQERWLGAFLLATLLAGGLGWFLLREIPVYATTATLLVERSNDRVVDIQQVVDNTVDSSLTDALLLTHIQQIQSHSFLARAIASLTEEEKVHVLEHYPLGPAELEKPAPGTNPPASPRTVEARIEDLISKGLKVDRINRTLLITLTVRHRDPLMAQFLANKLAGEYISYLIDRSTSSNDSALSFLKKQAEELRQTVETSEGKVQKYREANGLFFLEQNQNIVVEKLRTLSSSVTQARVARLALDARLEQAQHSLEEQGDSRQLAALPEFAGFANVQRQLDELRAKREVMSAKYGKKHPQMVENAQASAVLEKLRHEQIAAGIYDLKNQRDKAATDERQLAVELSAAEKESLRLDNLAVEYNFLRHEVETTRGTYSQILARLNETTISSRLQNTNIKLADPASLPDRPISPNRVKIGGAVGLLGLLCLIGYPLIADAMDKRIRWPASIEHSLDALLLGEIEKVRKVKPEERARLVSNSLDEHVSEEFRGLYNQIRLSSKTAFPKTLLISSTIPAEGKSFVACNLAGSFAAHGHRVLLVDADYRRPSLHRAFGLNNELGFLVWADATKEGNEEAEQRQLGIVEVSPKLSLLRTGGTSRKFTELLEAGPMARLLKNLKTQFSVIIIDSPPAGVFPDAEAITGLADELVFVCRFEGANRDHARQTLQRLRNREVHFLGVVLNGTPRHNGFGYHQSRWNRGAKYYKSYTESS